MFESTSSGQIASARWADPDYITNKYFYQPGDIWLGRNPHNANYAIGHRDDRHIMVCAGAGSGKGRSFIVNNLALYPGSTITYDPKGELPDILAARRSTGDEICEGMGQDVFVLDPLRRSTVAEEYRGYCDPVAMLDPEDDELSTWCYRLANSLVKKKESGQAQDWADKGIAFVALVIEHVVTSPGFNEEDRNLHKVYELVLQGDVVQARLLTEVFESHVKEHNAQLREDQKTGERMDENPVKPKVFEPYEALLENMQRNERATRFLAMEARAIQREMVKVEKYFASVTGEAREGLRWLRSPGIEKVLSGKGMDKSRLFDPRRLKTDPKGISLFIVLPVDDLKENEPWLQSLFVGIFAAIRSQKVKPAYPILTVLDEFSSLGYQEYIATSLDNIRGAGMKIAFIVQNFGKLKKLYGDEMESFFTNSGLELYFGKIGQIAAEYVKKELGETEVVRVARSVNSSQSGSEATGETITYTTTTSSGGSDAHGRQSGQSSTQSEGTNWSKGVNWSDSKNWGQSRGKNMGTNYGPHVFFEGLEHSNTYGTNLSRNTGGGHTSGGNRMHGSNKSRSETANTSESHTQTSTWQTGESKAKGETFTRTEGYQIGGGVAETFHKKPLIEAHEFNSYLRSFDGSEHDHPAYPGMMLVRIHGEAPFFVRRSNYDQDSYFQRCFSADPLHGFLPLSKQPMLGYQYTPDHVVDFQIPNPAPHLAQLNDIQLYYEAAGHHPDTMREYLVGSLQDARIEFVFPTRPHQRFKEGDSLLRLESSSAAFMDRQGVCLEINAGNSGRVLAVYNPYERTNDRKIMTVLSDKAFAPELKERISLDAFQPVLVSLKNTALDVIQDEKNKQRLALEEQQRLQIEADKKKRYQDELQRERQEKEQAAAELADRKKQFNEIKLLNLKHNTREISVESSIACLMLLFTFAISFAFIPLSSSIEIRSAHWLVENALLAEKTDYRYIKLFLNDTKRELGITIELIIIITIMILLVIEFMNGFWEKFDTVSDLLFQRRKILSRKFR